MLRLASWRWMMSKNKFAGPDHYEHEIHDENDKKVGTLRVKPSGILWKPVDKQKFHAVKLDKFIDWITDPATGAKLAKK
jgi:hypothetical protein